MPKPLPVTAQELAEYLGEGWVPSPPGASKDGWAVLVDASGEKVWYYGLLFDWISEPGFSSPEEVLSALEDQRKLFIQRCEENLTHAQQVPTLAEIGVQL